MPIRFFFFKLRAFAWGGAATLQIAEVKHWLPGLSLQLLLGPLRRDFLSHFWTRLTAFFHDKFLDDVVHDVLVPALAQRSRDAEIASALHPFVSDHRRIIVHLSYPVQSISFDHVAGSKVVARTRREVRKRTACYRHGISLVLKSVSRQGA
jgi:hypothetical protein